MGRVLEGACILLLFVGLQNGARNVYVVKVDLQVVPAKRRRTPRPPTLNAPPLSPPAGDALDPRYGKVPNKCARALIYSLSPSTPPPQPHTHSRATGPLPIRAASRHARGLCHRLRCRRTASAADRKTLFLARVCLGLDCQQHGI